MILDDYLLNSQPKFIAERIALCEAVKPNFATNHGWGAAHGDRRQSDKDPFKGFVCQDLRASDSSRNVYLQKEK